MTIRAVLIGLVLALALASMGYVNDVWMQFTCIGSDLMPTHAYGLLLVGLLVVNPLLRLIGRWAFKPGEWVVMLAMVLMGSVIAGTGLLWTWPHPLITPIQDQRQSPGWQSKDLLQYVPPQMMVPDVYREYAQGRGESLQPGDRSWRDPASRTAPPEVMAQLDTEDARLIKGYAVGLAPHGGRLAWDDVPWDKWTRPLSFWFVLLGLNFIAGLAMAVIVHRQWSQREHLSYPMVISVNELIAPPEQGLVNPLFRNSRFWIGFGIAFLVLLINGYYAWNKNSIQVPMGISLVPFRELLGPIAKVPSVNILDLTFFFAAVGLGYFLTSEASFSLGISGWLYALAVAPLIVAGVNVQTDLLAGGLPAYMYFGAYVGMGVMVLYLGRRFYWQALKSLVLGSKRAQDVLPSETAAVRILFLASVAMVAMLAWIGLSVWLAVAFVALTHLLFLMVGRVNAVTGLFIIQPCWHPVGILLAMLGGFVLGPQALIILAMLCVTLTIDPRIAAVPLAMNVLKLGELRQVKPGRLAGWMGVGIILAMIVGVAVTVYVIYNFGLAGTTSGDTRWALQVAQYPFQMLERTINSLNSADELAAAQSTLGWARLGHISSAQYFWPAASVGLFLVLACSWLRLRFSGWPLHPLLFLVWGTHWTTTFAPSFLLAWLLKDAITKYGGQKAYFAARPVFLGMMAGEFAAGLLWTIVGVAYFGVTGVTGPRFLVRP